MASYFVEVKTVNFIFGLEINNGVVIKAPILFKWMTNKKMSELRSWFANNNAALAKILGVKRHSFNVEFVREKYEQ